MIFRSCLLLEAKDKTPFAYFLFWGVCRQFSA